MPSPPRRSPLARPAIALAALALAACAAPPRPAAVAPRAAAVVPGPPAPPEPPAPAAPPATPAPGRSPFHAVARFDGSWPTLAPVGGHGFLLVDGLVIDVEGDDLAVDAKKQKGIERFRGPNGFGNVVAAGGVWPASAWLATIEVLGRGGTSVLYRWERSKWVARRRGYGNAMIVGFSPWSKGRTLALVSDQMAADARFDVVAGPPAPAPKPARVKGPDGYPCYTRLAPSGVAALATGEVFMLGEDCPARQNERSAFAVERWAPGARASTIDPLPPLAAATRIVALGPDEVYVAATEGEGEASRPMLLRFDGSGWAPAPPPGEGGGEFHHLSASPEGSLYALVEGQVWARPRGGDWGRIDLPALDDDRTLVAGQLWARGDGDLWVLAAEREPGSKAPPGEGDVLLHTRPATRPFIMPAALPGAGTNG